jgi:hypothetical protein
MSGIKISDLPAAAAALGAMQFEVNDAGTSRRVTADQIKTFASAGWAYTSAEETITTASTLTLAHGLGVLPSEVRLVVRCVVAQTPYAVGDEVGITNITVSGVVYNPMVTADGTSLFIRTPSSGIGLFNNSGALMAATLSSWRYVVRARP